MSKEILNNKLYKICIIVLYLCFLIRINSTKKLISEGSNLNIYIQYVILILLLFGLAIIIGSLTFFCN